MPLPTIVTPTYELTLPSNKKQVKYRPFLVKEEKVLILAMESEDSSEINRAIKSVLKDCILTRGINVEHLPSFDIEYLFLNIRSKSVGESVDLIITCPDDNLTKVDVTVNIDEIEVIIPEDHSPEIKVDDNIKIKMKYPSLKEFVENNFNFNANLNNAQAINKSFEIVASCIDQVYTDEEVWSSSDVSKKELIEWIQKMDANQYKGIEKFFDTMPKLSHTLKVKNPNTGVESDVTLEGLSSFFG